MIVNISDLKDSGLKGPVQSYKTYVNSLLHISSFYNSKGFEIERINYKEGRKDNRFVLKNEGNLILVFEEQFHNEELKSCELLYKFNNHGEILYDRGDVITYNENGTVLMKARYNANGDLQKIKRYKYDQKGNKIEKCSHDSMGNLYHKSSWDYDKKANCIKWETFDERGRTNQREIYIYDSVGHNIKRLSYDRDELTSIYTSQYDYRGNEVFWDSENQKHGDYSQFYYSYKYNEYDQLIQVTEMNENESIKVETTYHYDNTGNLIKKVEINNYFEQPIVTTTSYLITYFENTSC